MSESNWIQMGLLLATVIGLYFMLRRDNRRSNQEIVIAALQDFKEKSAMEKRLSLLEQKVDLNDSAINCEIKELKVMITELFNRINKHLEYSVK